MSLSDSHLEAWRAVVTTHAAVTDRVGKSFAAQDLPPLSWFELLWAIDRSPDGRPRMSDLAEYLTLSRGGITKLVDRLTDAGYIQRVACKEDRRSFQAELTPSGERILAEMRESYRAELSRHLDAISKQEAELITEALTRTTASVCDAEAEDSGAPRLEAA